MSEDWQLQANLCLWLVGNTVQALLAIKMGFEESGLSKKNMGSTGQRVQRGKVNPRLVFGVLLYFTVL